MLADLLKGIGKGAALALLFLSLGAVRATVVLLSGHPLRPLSADDVRLIACYIGAFAFAGGLVGLARPYMVTKTRTYIVYGIAGGAGMLVLTMGLSEGQRWPLFVIEAAFGVVLGCAMAYGLLRGRG